ncbi:MAG: hypothetical protein FJ087_01420 [Deltaproteobacteria bacterium]|nr:hypothetical protein [Deltaproteobacteria bacterium]
MGDDRIDAAVAAIVADHGAAAEARARQGARQVATYWRAEDGTPETFVSFCRAQFVPEGALLDAMLARVERDMEAVIGHNVALSRALREATDLAIEPELPSDLLFAALNPFDHLVEDAFRTRVAFAILLNFRLYPAGELARATPSRRGLAEARLTGAFSIRVPGEVRAAATRAYAAADDYIARYNVRMDRVVTADGIKPFPEGLRLISHWGLRDHLKGLYGDPNGLEGQRLILKVMERIVRQEIPAAAIDNTDVLWDPVANRVTTTDGKPADAAREPDRRFAQLLEVFRAERGIDPHSPAFPTHVSRKFDLEREIPEETVRALLVAVLTDPVAGDVAKHVRKRVGRPLEAFDIWYDGFKARGAIPEPERDRAVRARYPDIAAFQADVAGVLGRLGFSKENADFLASKIDVDASRGAGHAMGAGMRSDNAHLRTRVPKGGMDYKGYNIALHELGHCVEQVFSLNRVDRTLLAGVPNTAFTEAFAFLFQDRDLDVLGLGKADERTKALRAVDAFWMTFEISGVGLLDMAVWHWMYDHPDATPAQLRDAVVAEATAIWNRYYAPVLGVRDSPLLAIYSHMISAGLYLPDYPIGHLIHAQIEQFVEGKGLAAEMERMCVQGRVTPDAWMRGAVGAPLSARPLIDAARKGLKAL